MQPTVNTLLYATEHLEPHLVDMRQANIYRAQRAYHPVAPTPRRLRLEAVFALLLAPFAVFGLPLIPALVLGYHVLHHTLPDAAYHEDRTRGIALIALCVTYVGAAVLAGSSLLHLLH